MIGGMINTLSVKAFLALQSFFKGLASDEDGLEVVQVVLIILIGVLLIAVLWGVLSGWLGELWGRITSSTELAEPTW